jgi:hypothetical protein
MSETGKKLTDQELEYLLQELQLHVSDENRGRDRAEQMAQFYLTAITAIGGAVVLILSTSPSFVLGILTVLIGVLFALIFTIFILLRFCSYREAITLIVLRTWTVRLTIASYGIRPAKQFLPDEGEKLISGFSGRILF